MRVRALAAALACAALLAGCGGDGEDTSSMPTEKGTAPLEVVVGEEFTWNGFHVEDGWTLGSVDREVALEQMTNPEVTGSVTNESDEERFVLWELVFAKDGEDVATVNCSGMELQEGQGTTFECPGFGQQMPEGYDTVVVQEITR